MSNKHKGGRSRVPPHLALSEPVYVLLRPHERQELDKLARDPDGPKSRSAIMRAALRDWLARQKKKERATRKETG